MKWLPLGPSPSLGGHAQQVPSLGASLLPAFSTQACAVLMPSFLKARACFFESSWLHGAGSG